MHIGYVLFNVRSQNYLSGKFFLSLEPAEAAAARLTTRYSQYIVVPVVAVSS